MLNFPKDHLLQIEVTCGRLLYELKSIWDEIGKSNSERDIKLIEIQQECLLIYRSKIEEAKKYKEDLERQIALAQAEIKAICSALDDPNLHFKELSSSSMCLREQLEAISPQLEEMRRKRDERKAQFIEILERINSILRELKPSNTPYMGIDETDLSVRRLLELKSQLENLKREKADRKKQVRELLDSLSSLSLVLGIDIKQILQGELGSSVAELNISDAVIQCLVYETERLRGIKRSRMEKMQDMVTSMLELWTLMDTPVEEQQTFRKVASNIAASENEITEPNSLSVDFLNNVEEEVRRLENLKTSEMRDLVIKKKYELEHISTRAHINEGNMEMESMLGALETGGVDPSIILEGLECKISNAKEEAFNRKEILERVEKFLAAREEETWLDEYNRDDNRYSVAKGAHLVLKRAEKARAIVSKIPGMVEALVSKTKAWEKERGLEFRYDGKGLVAMLEDYTKQRLEREQERKRRREQRKLKTEPHESKLSGSKGSFKGLKKQVLSRTLSGRHDRKPSVSGTPRSAKEAVSTPFSSRRSELGPTASKRRQLDPWYSENGSRPSTPSKSDYVNGSTPSKSDFYTGRVGDYDDDEEEEEEISSKTPRSVSSSAPFF